MARREMRIGFGQVIVLWAVLGLIMVLVFWFGYQTGMNRGNALAMEEGDKHAVRLPVVEPVAQMDPAPSQEFGADREEIAKDTALSVLEDNNLEPDKKVPPGASQGGQESDPTFDFSAVKESTQAKTRDVSGGDESQAVEVKELPSAGIRSRSTDELLQASRGSVTSLSENQAKKKAPAEKEVIADKVAEVSPTIPKTAAPTAGIYSGKLASGWYVQVAATLSLSEAKQINRKFTKVGMDALIERAEVRKRIYYRILLGAYNSQEKADQIKKDLRKRKLVRDEPFLKHVN